MPHVVEPFTKRPYSDALSLLRSAHDYLVVRAREVIAGTEIQNSNWGASVKRTPVALNVGEVPQLIGKHEERLGEVINIAATLERLIDGIQWFASHPNYRDGGWFPALIPTVAYESRHWGLNVGIIPSYQDRLHGAITFQFKVRFAAPAAASGH